MSASAIARVAPAPTHAFLNVERSLGGRLWRARPVDDSLAEAHRRKLSLPEIAARLLAARGVSIADAPAFLDPTLRGFFPDPSSFKDMDEAARVIEDAIAADKPCAVFADYDVDGGTSAALLARYFRARGRALRIYVPQREEGYGPSVQAFERLKAEGIALIITVDCGAAAHGPLEAAAALGVDVVVFDHHLMSAPPPPALAVVNPNRPDCTSGQGHLTAAGVVLVALAAINREARKRGSIGSNHLPDLISWLDLSALGTVCDVAPLTGFNRAIVAQGLKILARKENIGIRALAEVAGRPALGQVYDLGFVMGPRLNAGGRVGDSTLAARLLSTDDPAEAAELAQELDAHNQRRRAHEAEMLEAAIGQAEAEAHERPVVIVGQPDWHPGVIGIAAGRLKERLMKPVIVLGGEGVFAKGSGRSVPGVNLGAAVAAAAKAGVLAAGGGHAMAAGLTMEWDKLAAFRDFMTEALSSELAAAEGEARTLWIDAPAAIAVCDLALLDAVDRVGPFGAGHPEPVFALANVRVGWSKLTKTGDHVSCALEDLNGRKLSAIAFRAGPETALGEALLKKQGLLHVAVKLKRDDYGGAARVKAELLDAAPAL